MEKVNWLGVVAYRLEPTRALACSPYCWVAVQETLMMKGHNHRDVKKDATHR